MTRAKQNSRCIVQVERIKVNLAKVLIPPTRNNGHRMKLLIASDMTSWALNYYWLEYSLFQGE